MKVLILLSFLITSQAWAQKKLSAQVFQSNVRPALSGILNDFYQMVSLFPDFPKELIVVIDAVDELQNEKALLQEKCPHLINPICLENLNAVKAKLSNIAAKTMSLASHQKMSGALHINTISGIRLSNDFFVALEEIKGRIDNIAFKLKAQVSTKDPTHQLIKQLDQLSTLLSLSVVEYVPYTYKDDFRHFYFNFVHPVQQHISKSQNFEFLNRNVNSLNFALNLLVQNLTKRNKKTPDGMAPYLNLVHNRWNSILRYYF